MTPRARSTPGDLSEWIRKRITLNLAFLDWIAETARLDAGILRELERLYDGLGRYAALGAPLRDCSPTDLSTIAGHPSLLIDEPDLTQHVKAAQASSQSPAAAVERRLLEAWLGRPIK